MSKIDLLQFGLTQCASGESEQPEGLDRQGEALTLRFESEPRTLWCRMHPRGRPSFTPTLLQEMTEAQASVRQVMAARRPGEPPPIRHVVLASGNPGIYNLGGDLPLFAAAIRAGDRAALAAYAHRCIDIVHETSSGYGHGLASIALVQGDALGGGFEAALSCTVVVAERSARLGLPEVLFNLFPGMGAYSFLSRRISAFAAEKLILSGRLYTAEELHAMGIVDILADDGEGEAAIRDYIRADARRFDVHQALHQARRRVQGLDRAELIDVTELWVDTAMRLSHEDLRRMERLAGAQERRVKANPDRHAQAA